MLALPAKIHSFRPRSCDKSHSFGKCARRILEATLGKSVILPRFIKLFECNVTLPAIKRRLSSSDTPSLRRVKLRLPSGNGVEKYRFSTSLSDFFNVPTAPQRLYERYVRLSIYNICAKSYALPLLFVNTKRIRVQRHAAAFHVFALAKTFHFCAEDILASCSLLSAQKFHVRSKGTQFRSLFIVPLRRMLRVQRHAACRIVKAHLFKGVRKAASSYVPA